MKYININDIDLDNPDSCFHFTKTVNVESINENGLMSTIGDKSKDVDEQEKVCFTKSLEGHLGLVNSILSRFALCLYKNKESLFEAFMSEIPEEQKGVFREYFKNMRNDLVLQRRIIRHYNKELKKIDNPDSEEYKEVLDKMNQNKIIRNNILYDFSCNCTYYWLNSGIYYYLDINKCKNQEEYEKLTPEEQSNIYYFDETYDEKGRPSKNYDFHAIPGKGIPAEKLSIITTGDSINAADVIMCLMKYYKQKNAGKEFPEYYEDDISWLDKFYQYLSNQKDLSEQKEEDINIENKEDNKVKKR